MSTYLPRDIDGAPIMVLGFRDQAAHQIAATATSARNTTAFNAGTRVVSLYATAPIFIRLGDSAATATSSDHYIPANTYLDLDIGGGKSDHDAYMAVIAATAQTGTVYVSEKI